MQRVRMLAGCTEGQEEEELKTIVDAIEAYEVKAVAAWKFARKDRRGGLAGAIRQPSVAVTAPTNGVSIDPHPAAGDVLGSGVRLRRRAPVGKTLIFRVDA